jgi:hypothetical protein
LLLPPNWAVVFASQKDLQEAMQGNPEVSDMSKRFNEVDPDVFRLVAMNVDRTYIKAGSPTLLTINAYKDAVASAMPMAFVTAMIEDKILQDATSTTWNVIENANGVEVGIVEGARTFAFPGANIRVREMVIAFQANKKLIVIEIAVPTQYAEQILTPFDETIDTIKVDIR